MEWLYISVLQNCICTVIRVHADIAVDLRLLKPCERPQTPRQHTEGCGEQESSDIKMVVLSHPHRRTEHEASLEVVGKLKHPESFIKEQETGILLLAHCLRKNISVSSCMYST